MTIEKIITSPKSVRLQYFKQEFPNAELILWENFFVDDNDFLLVTNKDELVTKNKMYEDAELLLNMKGRIIIE